MRAPEIFKFFFRHLSNGKCYLVGAIDREDAIHQAAEICGDYNFIEENLPEAYQ